MHGALLRSGLPRFRGQGRRAREAAPHVDMHFGEQALLRVADLGYMSDHEDDGYVLSSADALNAPNTTGSLTCFG